MKQLSFYVACFCLILLGYAPLKAQDLQIFRIGTGGVAGTYFPIGGLLADAISNPPGARGCDEGGNCGVEGLVAIAQSSNGSVANIKGIADGQLDSGLAQSDVAFAAYNGSLEGVNNAEDLRLIASLYIESVHFVVTKESGIQSINDLLGKRVSLDDAGSGTQINAKLILDNFGIGTNEILPFYVKPAQSGRLMRSGELDAFVIVAGYPTLSVTELANEQAINLLPLEGSEIDDLFEQYPFFSRDRIPSGVYEGVPETSTLGVVAQWITSANIDDELIYEITKSLWHDTTRQLLDNGHAKGQAITLQSALEGAAVPLHPGAERYYREEGLVLDDN